MKRRDTIIIAALVNAGLLLLLFATAISTSPSEEPSDAQNSVPKIAAVAQEERALAMSENIPTMPGDEVDQVLSQWAPDNAPLPPAVNLQVGQPPVSPLRENSPVVAESREEKVSGTAQITVKKGDVLERIAKANGTTVKEIMRLNNLSSTRLHIGQVLRVPTHTLEKKKGSVQVSPPPMKKNASETNRYYTMKKGDNLWTVASKNHTKVEDLLRLNGMSEERARRLKPGDVIRTR